MVYLHNSNTIKLDCVVLGSLQALMSHPSFHRLAFLRGIEVVGPNAWFLHARAAEVPKILMDAHLWNVQWNWRIPPLTQVRVMETECMRLRLSVPTTTPPQISPIPHPFQVQHDSPRALECVLQTVPSSEPITAYLDPNFDGFIVASGLGTSEAHRL